MLRQRNTDPKHHMQLAWLPHHGEAVQVLRRRRIVEEAPPLFPLFIRPVHAALVRPLGST